MKEKLEDIRSKKKKSQKHQLLLLVSYFVTGLLIGLVSKYSDIAEGSFWVVMSDITSGLGVWIAIGTLIAFFSHRPRWSVIGVMTFFLGMLLSYYLYSLILFGYFPQYYFNYWFIVAIVSLPAAYLIWYTKGHHWLSTVGSTLPVAFIFAEGIKIFETHSIAYLFLLLMGAGLFLVLFKDKKEKIDRGIGIICLSLFTSLTLNLGIVTYILTTS